MPRSAGAARRRSRAAATCWSTAASAPDVHADRHRLRGRARASTPRSALRRERASRCASCRCRAPSAVRRAARAEYRDSVLPPGVHARRHRGRRRATAGGATSAAAAPVHRHGHASAPRRPPKKLFEHFGFTADNVIRTVAGGCSKS
ncbi:MAG: hypothetical protein MZW92_03900 [Comamonadaceae bacterium]|nr:hypothetical protein [Comamonadaceae bacterium]